MNKVFVSGKIVNDLILRTPEENGAHLIIKLCIRHKTRSGEQRSELYRINAWNGVAKWASENLKRGQLISVQGYLTQRRIRNADATVTATEITATEFTVGRLPAENEKSAASETMPSQEDPRHSAG